MSDKSKTVLTFTETIAEVALPPDSTSEEDTQETEEEGDYHEKGALSRVQNLGGKVSRRGKKTLKAFMPSKVSVDEVSLLKVCADYILSGNAVDTKVRTSKIYLPTFSLKQSCIKREPASCRFMNK